MKNYSLLIVFLLLLFSLQCKRNVDFIEETPPNIPQTEIYQSNKIHIDRNTKLLYFSVNQNIAIYNYQTEEIRRKTAPFRLSFNFDIGYHKGAPEVYMGQINNIKILDGITLAPKDSITVFKAPYRRLISDIEVGPNNVFVVGACENRAILFNRATESITAEPINDNQCVAIHSYVNQTENTIGVISVGYDFRHIPIIITLDKFDFTGQLIESQSTSNVELASSDLIVTNNNAAYFVTGRQLFSKQDLSEIAILDNSYIDMVISDDGQFIYGLSETGQQIHVINFNTRDIERTIDLDARAVRLFLDDRTLIVVHALLIGAPFSEEESLEISKISI